MGANSATRRLMKRLLYPVTNEHTYRYMQAVSKAWDIRSGSWSEPELELIPYAVAPGETVFDIGANFGMWCYHLSRHIGDGRIYAFEPVPFTHQTLRQVARLLRFRNVEIIPKGCSDRTGEITFAVPVQDSGAVAAGLAYRGGRNDDHPGKETQVRWSATRDIKGEVVALDQFLPAVERLSLIKCDIEGAELYDFRVADLTGFFFGKGYEIYHYTSDGGRGRLRAVEVSGVEEDNYAFIHPTRRDRFAALLEA